MKPEPEAAIRIVSATDVDVDAAERAIAAMPPEEREALLAMLGERLDGTFIVLSEEDRGLL
jgi:hypothetical protein